MLFLEKELLVDPCPEVERVEAVEMVSETEPLSDPPKSEAIWGGLAEKLIFPLLSITGKYRSSAIMTSMASLPAVLGLLFHGAF